MTFGNCKGKGLLAVFAVVLSIVLAGSATAQTGSATIQGTVTDQQGAVVAGATVKLVNESRGFSRTVVTSSSGAYSFSSVPPDTYQLTIEANGFKKLVQSSVSALVDKTTSIDAMLEPGAVSEVVNVAADAGLGFGAEDRPAYCAAKAGIVRLTAALCSLKDQKIRVNCIAPDVIEEVEDFATIAVALALREDCAGRVVLYRAGRAAELVEFGDPGFRQTQPL